MTHKTVLNSTKMHCKKNIKTAPNPNTTHIPKCVQGCPFYFKIPAFQSYSSVFSAVLFFLSSE